MRVRWPFRAALAATALGTAALVLVPVGHSAWASWRQHQQDRRDQVASARWLAHARPAMEMLAQLRAPARTHSCVTQQLTRKTGALCWRGPLSPVAVTATLVAELRGIGGQAVVAACVQNLALGPVCRVSAKIAASNFSALVGPNLTAKRGRYTHHGASVQGDLILGALQLPRGDPITLPA